MLPLLTLGSQIKRNLRRHLKSIGFEKDDDGLLRPPAMTKECFRNLHVSQRDAKLAEEAEFIRKTWPILKIYFANGTEVVPERISPRLELIDAGTWQSDLFRLTCLTWSVPVSQGYGRRMRFLVWDESNQKLIGVLALGDPVFNLRVRDNWIGWTLTQREQLLVNLLDAYVLGSVPPYSSLLGGKLVASLIRSREVKEIFSARYGQSRGIISQKRKHAELCLVTTTSALGRSSLYNRLRLEGKTLFFSIGFTSGWGHFHIPDALFAQMRLYLEKLDDEYSDNYRFGDGPNWKLRAVRKVLSKVGLDPDLMRHGIPREVFVCPLASNARQFLTGKAEKPNFKGLKSVAEISPLALDRWVVPRAKRRPEFRLWQRDNLKLLLGLSEREFTTTRIAAVRAGGM